MPGGSLVAVGVLRFSYLGLRLLRSRPCLLRKPNSPCFGRALLLVPQRHGQENPPGVQDQDPGHQLRAGAHPAARSCCTGARCTPRCATCPTARDGASICATRRRGSRPGRPWFPSFVVRRPEQSRRRTARLDGEGGPLAPGAPPAGARRRHRQDQPLGRQRAGVRLNRVQSAKCKVSASAGCTVAVVEVGPSRRRRGKARTESPKSPAPAARSRSRRRRVG